MLLGCIADDFTGATDLANTLTRRGMACVQYNGLPGEGQASAGEDAAIVALKTRSIPAAEAVAQSLAALHWLRGQGCRKVFFKYCSTFDSTDQGNIGPVAEALMEALDTDFTVACPAAPENGRTVYQGHLFVGDSLLSETGMRHHPLNPMTDSNLVRVLGRQSKGKVGLLPHGTVALGAESVRREIEALKQAGHRLAIADALNDGDLETIAEASADLPLLTGGSGLALGLPALFRRAGALARKEPAALASPGGGGAVLSGSCSEATQRQVERMCTIHAHYRLDPQELARDEGAVEAALSWAEDCLGEAPILLYSTANPEELATVQESLGQEQASEAVERAMGRIAEGLVERGVRRLVVAGGETSGAVVTALEVTRLAIGQEIDPGVPWTQSLDDPPIALALKSGNFGADDFFTKAFEVLKQGNRS